MRGRENLYCVCHLPNAQSFFCGVLLQLVRQVSTRSGIQLGALPWASRVSSTFHFITSICFQEYGCIVHNRYKHGKKNKSHHFNFKRERVNF